MYRSGVAVVFWFLFMMNTSADALATSESSNSELPQLQPSDPNKKLPSIKLGETIRFEELGPIILGTDGSTRRIENWDTLTEGEQKATWRRISKRNEERRQVLLKQQEEQLKQQEEIEEKADEL